MSTESKSTALTIPKSADESPIAIISDPTAGSALAQMVKDLGGDLDIFELPRIALPQGKGTSFEITGEDSAKTVDVVIAWHNFKTYSYWSVPVTDGEPGPPNCSSNDGYTGFGVRHKYGEETPEDATPSEQACETCVHGQFKSGDLPGKPSKGMACRQGGQMLVFTMDAQAPYLVPVPPASGKSARKIVMDCAKGGGSMNSSVVQLYMTPDKSDGGILYQKLAGKFLRKLTAEEMGRFGQIAEALGSASKAQAPNAEA